MARISGIDLPRDKRIEVALTYIYGIGPARAAKVLEVTGIDPDIRVKDLTEEQEAKLRDAIEHHYIIEGDLRYEHQAPQRDRLLPRPASSPWPARSRSAHQDQRPYPQGSQEDHCEQEEVRRDM